MINDYINTIFNTDCLEGMKGMPDNLVDLRIHRIICLKVQSGNGIIVLF